MDTKNNNYREFYTSSERDYVTERFYNFQVDYVKLSLQVNTRAEIKWHNLIPHPNLKNQYTLNPELNEFAKNFSLYFRKDNRVFMKFSIPYFLKGHNYTQISKDDLEEVELKLKNWINIDVKYAKVEEFEFGMFERIDIENKEFLSGVLSVGSYNLEKSDPRFKMFGVSKQKMHYKIYDAVANSKSKKTFSRGNFPQDQLIKHELKFEKACQYFKRNLSYNDFYETIYLRNECERLLLQNRKNLILKQELEFIPKKKDLNNILFTALKNLESGRKYGSIIKLLYEIIDKANLSPSQKSKRRKSIEILENDYSSLPV